MPVPDDRELVNLSDKLVETMRATFSTPQNYRPVHAKGQLCRGTLTTYNDASKLSKAPIFNQVSTSLIMRFSTDVGFRDLPDGGENGSRGFAVRFVLSQNGYTQYDGVMNHSKADAAKQCKNYQFDDLEWRMKNNKPIKYRLVAQLAEDGNPTNDSTKVWPETNEIA